MNEPTEARLDKIDASHARLHSLVKEIEDILETLVTNDTEIIEALTQILLVVPQIQARNEQSHAMFLDDLRQQLNQFTLEIAQSRIAAPGALKPALAGTTPFLTDNPEAALLRHLYSFLPEPLALDIGANTGEFSEQLLQAGYDVYAFEPNPETFARLQKKLGGNVHFHAFPYALGSSDETAKLHVAGNSKEEHKFGDPSLFSSLIAHPMPREVPFTHDVAVEVRKLETLRAAGEIPARAGAIKIDTEGFDPEVVRGLGEDATPVVMTEYWNEAHLFARSGHGQLEKMAAQMKDRGYRWYVVICHQEDKGTITFHANRFDTPAESWGNAAFFRDHKLFSRAYAWCEAVLAPTDPA